VARVTWKDPAAAIALFLVAILGALLVLGKPVAPDLWTIVSLIVAFFFGHVSALAGTGQVIKALNGNAGANLTHTSPDRGTSGPTTPAASSPSSAPSSSSAPADPPTFGGTAPSLPADGATA
jgi:hypothetical protein